MHNQGGSIALRISAGSLLIILLCLSASCIPNVTADKAAEHTPLMFRADPSHSGMNDDGGITPVETLVWMNISGDRVYSSPAVVDGVVYIGSDDNNVYAFDAETGTEVWTFETGGRVLTSPAVVGGVVYIGSYDKNLYALESYTGNALWTFPMDGWVTADPVVADGVVYSGSLGDKLYAVNTTTGEEIWSVSLGEDYSVASSPAVCGGVVYVGGGGGLLHALNATDGSEIWNFTSGYGISSSPSIDDGKVFYSSWDKIVYALDASNGAMLWNFTTGGSGEMDSSPAVAYGVVYIGGCDNNVYALDALTGEEIWHFSTGNVVYSSPTYANDVVYVGSWDGKMYAIDALTGEEIWHFSTGDPIFSSPAVAKGIVYFGSLDHSIYAVGQPPDSPPVADFTANETFGLVPMTVQFTDSSTGQGLSYQWDFGDGTANSTEQNPVYTYTVGGTYDVTLTVGNNAGSSTLWKEGYITAMEPMPPIGGDPAYFMIHSNVDGAEVYFNGDWYAGTIENGTLLVETCTTCTPVWMYTVKKCGYFSLTQENDVFPGKDQTVHLYANLTAPKEPLIADFSANVTEASAPPLHVRFLGSHVGIAESWNWSFGDGTYSEEEEPAHTYTEFGNYTVSLTLSNSACQEDTMVKENFIRIAEKPPFAAGFTLSSSGGPAPFSVRCTDSSSGNPTRIVYDFGDGFMVMGPDSSHTYRSAGTYTITQTVAKFDPATRSTLKSTATKQVEVFKVFPLGPLAGFSASPVTGSAPLTVTFTDESLGDPTFFIYNTGDGFRLMGANPTYTYRTPGIYTVTQKVMKIDPISRQILSDVLVKENLIHVTAG
ncbi:MAG: outer membrane biogenesis protein BamB [Methanoregulaceae archaeon PtaB.Bin108]|nr:MAG: outer membrane biogenesis protein BamB [Methanoregulaceae archaeon PtaB.Bin108]